MVSIPKESEAATCEVATHCSKLLCSVSSKSSGNRDFGSENVPVEICAGQKGSPSGANRYSRGISERLLRPNLSTYCLGFLSLEWVESPSNPSRYLFRSFCFVRVVSRDKPSNKGVSGQVSPGVA
jgi:hypothetical protein